MLVMLDSYVSTVFLQPQDIANLAHGLARLRGLCDQQEDEAEAAAAAAAALPSFLRGLQVRVCARPHDSMRAYPSYHKTIYIYNRQEAALLLGAHEFKPSELAMAAYGLARLATPSHSTSSEEASVVDPAFLRAWGQALWARTTTGDGQMHPRELVVLLDSLVRLGYRYAHRHSLALYVVLT